MEERKIGMAPRLLTQGAMGVKEYALLMTDKRAIFILELSSKAGLGGVLGGAIGAAIASSIESKKTYNYEEVDTELLASMKGSVVIPHDMLEQMQFKSGTFSNSLSIRYRSSEGKSKKLHMNIIPPDSYLKQKKDAGIKRKDVLRQYLSEVQNLYQRSLPFTSSMKVMWVR